MIKKIYVVIVLLLVSKIGFCQFTYKELLNLTTKTNQEVTTFLLGNKKGWSYLKFDKENDSHIWKKGNEKLILTDKQKMWLKSLEEKGCKVLI